VRKPSRNLPVASKTSVWAAEKTGQVLVRTGPHPGRTESPVISGKEVGYVRRSEVSAMIALICFGRAGLVVQVEEPA
jgi:hypothetical protein